MNHTDHVNLLRDGVPEPGGIWADIGSGSGAFTLALAELLGCDGEIYSVDKDRGSLRSQQRAMQKHYPHIDVHYLTADFSQPLAIPTLDGIVMANALHFQPYAAQKQVVNLLKRSLQPGGRFVIVEYDVEHGNHWVPYPLAYRRWEKLAADCGFARSQLLARRPSRFLQAIYAAVSW